MKQNLQKVKKNSKMNQKNKNQEKRNSRFFFSKITKKWKLKNGGQGEGERGNSKNSKLRKEPKKTYKKMEA